MIENTKSLEHSKLVSRILDRGQKYHQICFMNIPNLDRKTEKLKAENINITRNLDQKLPESLHEVETITASTIGMDTIESLIRNKESFDFNPSIYCIPSQKENSKPSFEQTFDSSLKERLENQNIYKFDSRLVNSEISNKFDIKPVLNETQVYKRTEDTVLVEKFNKLLNSTSKIDESKHVDHVEHNSFLINEPKQAEMNFHLPSHIFNTSQLENDKSNPKQSINFH